jgi:hypothetical protein
MNAHDANENVWESLYRIYNDVVSVKTKHLTNLDLR